MKLPRPMEFFKLKAPDYNKEFKGLRIKAYPTFNDAKHRVNGERILVEDIRGNFTHQTMFEINGTHLVSMLDAYCEINKESLPGQETHEQFLDTVMTHAHKGNPIDGV